MESYRHTKENMKIVIIQHEENWWKRGILEAINIKKEKPTLNQDPVRFKLANISYCRS